MYYSLDRKRDANQLCSVVRTVPPVALAATHQMVSSGQLDATFVLDSAYLDTLSPAGELQAQWHDMATGSATIRCHEGPIRMCWTHLYSVKLRDRCTALHSPPRAV